MALNVSYVTRETTKNLGRNPTLTVASVITVAVSLTLAGVFLLVQEGVDKLAGNFRGDIELIVFLDPDISTAQREALAASLDDNPEVQDFHYVNQQQAFEEARELFEDQPTTQQLLREADVPPSFRITPTNPDVQSVNSLRDVYEGEPGVREVESATEAIKAIQDLSEKLIRGVFASSLVLGLIAILLIYNTLRTAMFARRREIEVMKLVGATNWFIRVPFILEGLVQAVLGGLLALLFMMAANTVLFGALSDGDYFQIFTAFDFTMATVLWASVKVGVAGVIIGALGAGLAVGRFLDV
ncbi:MAG TPA: permease-like cell division protein FtsX [Acidimicrobiales bacterium]|nr:permease-like cell division protein FtsX [Acidimicrobiales bacterium]